MKRSSAAGRRSRERRSSSLDDLHAMRETLPHFVLGREAMTSVLELAIGSNAYTSKGEARRGMAGGGFYINDVRVTDPTRAGAGAAL